MEQSKKKKEKDEEAKMLAATTAMKKSGQLQGRGMCGLRRRERGGGPRHPTNYRFVEGGT